MDNIIELLGQRKDKSRYPSRRCKYCEDSGIVTAVKKSFNEGDTGKPVFAFRCKCSKSSLISNKIPQWHRGLKGKYEPKYEE